jgi:hypothetical protein
VWYQKCQDLGWEHDVRIEDRFNWKAVYRAHFERCAPAKSSGLFLRSASRRSQQYEQSQSHTGSVLHVAIIPRRKEALRRNWKERLCTVNEYMYSAMCSKTPILSCVEFGAGLLASGYRDGTVKVRRGCPWAPGRRIFPVLLELTANEE